jgi:anthraniloyl-CoA monooxygenase
MRITIVGAGPAGLYFALLMKHADPSHEITVIERDGADDTFGWGIVFSDQTFAYLRDSDAPSFDDLVTNRETWDNVDVVHRHQKVSIHGNRFSGIARITFLKILQRRAEALGVHLRFRANVSDVSQLPPADLLVGADGANSSVRAHGARFFQPDVSAGRNRYIWLGTRRPHAVVPRHHVGAVRGALVQVQPVAQHLHSRVRSGDVGARRLCGDERSGHAEPALGDFHGGSRRRAAPLK